MYYLSSSKHTGTVSIKPIRQIKLALGLILEIVSRIINYETNNRKTLIPVEKSKHSTWEQFIKKLKRGQQIEKREVSIFFP